MRIIDLSFGSFLFPDACWTKRRLSEPYFSNWSKDFLHEVSLGLFASLRNQRIRVLRDAIHLWYICHNSHSIFVVAFSSFVGIVEFLWLFVWLFINLMMREQTLISGFASRFCFVKLTLGRMPIFHKAIACRCPSNKICTVVGEWHHGCLRLGYFFSSTHFDLVTRMARKVWRHCGLVFGHDRYSHAGNCIGLPSNTALFSFHWYNRHLFLFQHHIIPCDSSPLHLFRFSHVWRQNFSVEVSDLYSFSPSSSIFVSWASIPSGEFPCHTIPIRSWVVQNLVSSICTDSPEYHQMESSSLIIEFRPILYRIPEHSRYEEWWKTIQRNRELYREHQ